MKKINSKNLQLLVFLILSCAFFGVMALIKGVEQYGDSGQYLSMHIHREPLYPLWLLLIKAILGSYFNTGVLLCQGLLAALCTTYYCSYMTFTFGLKIGWGISIWAVTLIPHILTPIVSETGLIISSGILSEAICLPLFLVFLVQCHKIIVGNFKLAAITGFMLSFLLSLCRGQMMFTIILWMITVTVRCILEKKYRSIIFFFVFLFLYFFVRGYTIKTYNLIFNHRFIGNTYGHVNTLTNVIYAAKREMGEAIEEKEIRELFYSIYNEMEAQQLNDKQGVFSLWERGIYLEEVHDALKFDVVERVLNDHFKEKGMDDYIDRNISSDKYAAVMIRKILPQCIGTWLSNYFVLAIRGVVRTVAIINPVFIIYTILLLSYLWIKSIIEIRKNRNIIWGWMTVISVLIVMGLAFSTAFTIMCLSRYMIYGFAGIYTCIILGINDRYEQIKKRIKRN